MKQEIRDRFAEALRSGSYEQDPMLLGMRRKRGNTYTYDTWGVLCDLAVQDGVIEWGRPTPGETPGADSWNVLHDESGQPPGAVRRWAGLPDKEPMFHLTQDEWKAVGNSLGNAEGLNDLISIGATSIGVLSVIGTPFSLIADLLEKYILAT